MHGAEMMIITSLGTFTITPKDTKGTYIYKNGILVCVADNIPYWDRDGLVEAIETHKELVSEKIGNEFLFITEDNVKQALHQK